MGRNGVHIRARQAPGWKNVSSSRPWSASCLRRRSKRYKDYEGHAVRAGKMDILRAA